MKAKNDKSIQFNFDDKVVSASHADSILSAVLRTGLELDHACGGHATCGTCLIEVVQGLETLPARDELESEMAHDRGFSDQERLACQMQPHAGLVLRKKNYKA